MRTLQQMWEGAITELSEELGQMAEQGAFIRWFNDGRSRLNYYVGATAPIVWIAGDYTVQLPSDFCDLDSLVPNDGVSVPAFRVWRDKLRFEGKATGPGGATLFYSTLPAEITGEAPSVLPDVLDQALVSYGCFRFFKWLATSRTDYRRYSTIAQGNAADIPQLLAAAAGHRQDFTEALDAYGLQPPVTFFGEV